MVHYFPLIAVVCEVCVFVCMDVCVGAVCVCVSEKRERDEMKMIGVELIHFSLLKPSARTLKQGEQ